MYMFDTTVSTTERNVGEVLRGRNTTHRLGRVIVRWNRGSVVPRTVPQGTVKSVTEVGNAFDSGCRVGLGGEMGNFGGGDGIRAPTGEVPRRNGRPPTWDPATHIMKGTCPARE